MNLVLRPYNFGAIPEKFANFEKSKVVLLPIPYDATTFYNPGTRFGPRAIIDASRYMEYYDEKLCKPFYTSGIALLSDLEPIKVPELMYKRVYEAISYLIKKNKFVISLGGEHSLTNPIVKAHSDNYKGISVLQLDAHADLDDELEGTEHHHGAVMKRINEFCPTSQVGIRSMSEDSFDYIHEKKLKVLYARDIVGKKDWHEDAISPLTDNVYITLDVDIFDPSIMPNTGTPEPGGLTFYEVLDFLEFVISKKNVVGFDVVEHSPGISKAPDFMLAKLIQRVIGMLRDVQKWEELKQKE